MGGFRSPSAQAPIPGQLGTQLRSMWLPLPPPAQAPQESKKQKKKKNKGA